ncbi:MAG: LegC family aminotransferase [Bdellovibrionia bacterium]
MNLTVGPAILSAIDSVLKNRKGQVQLHEPSFGDTEQETLKRCLESGFVSSVGELIGTFERLLAAYTGAAHVVACVNGTSALHVSYVLAGVEANDEVLMPAMTFVATANAAAYCGAVPHFVDVDESHLGIDPDKLELYLKEIAQSRGDACYNRATGRRIRALVAVHTFGHPCQLEKLEQICERYRIEFIEDAAESLGSRYHGRHLGTFARLAAASFNGNKIITTGGGGAIYCRDTKTADLAKHITTTGKQPHAYKFFHDMVAYNYRMPNLNAALGCAQMASLPKFFAQKRTLADRYAAAFRNVSGAKFFKEPEGSESNYWLNALLLDHADMTYRDSVIEFLRENGIMTRPVWSMLNSLPMYKNSPAMDLETSKDLEMRLINIPSSPFLAGNEAV